MADWRADRKMFKTDSVKWWQILFLFFYGPFSFSQLYWDIINIWHYVSLRCASSDYVLYILQNDYHNKVLTHLSPQIVTAICVCVVRTLKIYSLSNFQILYCINYSHSVVYHIPELIHLTTGSFYPLTTITHFSYPLLPAPNNH